MYSKNINLSQKPAKQNSSHSKQGSISLTGSFAIQNKRNSGGDGSLSNQISTQLTTNGGKK